jgi:GxxExxY protein
MGLIFIQNKNRKFDKTSNEIISAAIEVHKTLGPGFLESIYHNSLKIELKKRNLPFETEKKITIKYKYEEVGDHRLDLLVNSEVVVELKAIQNISDVHLTQVISYLKASGLRVGLILNFSRTKLDIKRVIQD